MAPPRRGDLSPEEKDLLAVIATGNTEEAGRLLGSKNVRVNCLDEGHYFLPSGPTAEEFGSVFSMIFL